MEKKSLWQMGLMLLPNLCIPIGFSAACLKLGDVEMAVLVWKAFGIACLQVMTLFILPMAFLGVLAYFVITMFMEARRLLKPPIP